MTLLGTQPEAIDLAEDRGRFGALLERLSLKAPPYALANSPEEALAAAPSVGFPLLVRPSYVLGGRAMELAYDEAMLADYFARTRPQGEIFLDRFLENAIEVDVDAICDGEDVWIGGIMQHVEEAGIHSGDSACVLPPHSLGAEMLDEIRARHARPRAGARRGRPDQHPVRRLRRGPVRHRGQPARVADGPVRLQGHRPAAGQARLPRDARREARGRWGCRDDPCGNHVSVKEAVLPFDRFAGTDALLGPEMRSTGEVMGVAADFPTAFAKAQAAVGTRLPSRGHGLPDRDRLPTRPAWSASPASCTTSASRSSPRAARRARSSAWASRSRRINKIQDGSPQRRRLDRPRRRRPRDQHADRHRGALGRLRDPPRGGRPRRPVHHHDRGRDGGRAGDRARRASSEPPVVSLQELHRNGVSDARMTRRAAPPAAGATA